MGRRKNKEVTRYYGMIRLGHKNNNTGGYDTIAEALNARMELAKKLNLI